MNSNLTKGLDALKSYRDNLPDVSEMGDIEAARGLGVASIGIGLTEMLAPKKVEHMLGIGNGENTGILRVLGLREILHGVDILTHEDPTPGVWGRVAGDMLDGVLLSVAAAKTRRPASFAATTAMVLGIVALDAIFAGRLSRKR